MNLDVTTAAVATRPTGEVEPETGSTASLPAAIAWLISAGVLTAADAERFCAAAAAVNKEPVQYLRGKVSLANLHEAVLRTGGQMSVSRLSDLPEWTVILNDIGGTLGGPTRTESLAVIANDVEGGDQLRCFVIHSARASAREVSAAVTSVIGARHHLAGRIEVADDILGVLYGEWDGRGRSNRGRRDQDADLHADFDKICEAAIDLRASDIHISSTGNRGAIYLRIDGALEHFREVTAEYALELCSSVYNTLSEASSAKESFIPTKPLDSSVERSLKQGLYRFRFSNVPMAPSGFDVTLRIIPIGVTTARKTPRELGYSADQEAALERLFARSSGLILVAGTTGSGKSTSVAHLLRKVAEDRPGRKIRTVEEPVEIIIPGAYQHPVTRIHGDSRDFMVMLRQLLRSDPDIIMIGEIRDGDTAEVAIQAVRSGHLCVSTIHADGAPICYDRLVGMNVPRLDLASVNLVAGLIYQKLVPLLCARCKIPAGSLDHGALPVEDQQRLERVCKVTDGTLDGVFVRSKQGCPYCRQRGVLGRTVCAEILRPAPDMLEAIAAGDSRKLWSLWRATINHADPADMTGRTAFEHALHKMREGVLAPEDVEAEFHYLDEPEYEALVQQP